MRLNVPMMSSVFHFVLSVCNKSLLVLYLNAGVPLKGSMTSLLYTMKWEWIHLLYHQHCKASCF